MTTTDIVNIVGRVIMEPYEDGQAPGPTLTLTQSTILAYVGVVFQDMLSKVSLIKTLFTQQVLAGNTQYPVPNDMSEVEGCLYGGQNLEQTTLDELDQYDPYWVSQIDNPTSWREDSLPLDTIAIFPSPRVDGAGYPGFPTPTQPVGVYDQINPNDNNLTMIGSKGTSTNTFTLGQTIPVFPDSFSLYLSYGVLQKIFEEDGENKDPLRASYCSQRYNEGIQLLMAIEGEVLEN